MPGLRRVLLGGLAVLAAVLVAAAAGCGGGDAGAGADPITVFAAASLTEVFPEIDGTPRYSFAGSDDLAAQIREGAPADVFASASPRYTDELSAEGLVEEPTVFATNRLVLIVPKDNPAGVHSTADLTKPGVKLVVAAETVPVGGYTRDVLRKLDLEAALDNVVSNEDDVKAVVSKVALGEGDAGFVYSTDAAVAGDDVSVLELPANVQPDINYTIAVVRSSERKDDAEAFVDLVFSPEGQSALEDAGFGPAGAA